MPTHNLRLSPVRRRGAHLVCAMLAIAGFSDTAQAQSAEATVEFLLAGVRPGGEMKRVVDEDEAVRTVTPTTKEGVWRFEYSRSFGADKTYTMSLDYELKKVTACRYDLKIRGNGTVVTMKYDFSGARDLEIRHDENPTPSGMISIDVVGADVERCEPQKGHACEAFDGNRFGYVAASEEEIRQAFAHFQENYCPKSGF
ncbi:hypothetical protein J2R99_000123 [Rhodopseudomonas julia]|uniref:Lipoprotein n=1 Tax=Rhodopseudomonas julia TaxID=200617 RepID=A0ABU0C185_9BRAD|nr:hypothetical protein [Rhodopseudomonas julia]MDQ0324274.1 hypothetical protein [Rhodopseudomonas julia]